VLLIITCIINGRLGFAPQMRTFVGGTSSKINDSTDEPFRRVRSIPTIRHISMQNDYNGCLQASHRCIYNVAFIIIQENQPLDTLSSLIFAPYSSSFFSFEKWRTGENPPWRLERMVAPQ
jgi:hypothetical protein